VVKREISEDDPAEGQRVTDQLDRIWVKYTGNEPPYGLRDPSLDERRVLFEMQVVSVATSAALTRRPGAEGSQPVSRMPRVSIAGGSVGGLTTALVLRDAGCDVQVFERSSTALQARGAGIAALDTTLDYLLKRGGFQVTDVCSSTGWIRFLNRDGSVQHEQPHRYRFSSWNTIYRSLLSLLDAGRYQLGTEVTGFAEQRGTVTVTLGTGQRVECDLLVCADGVGSPARARLLPAVRPAYSGYVAWRGTVPEQDLSPGTRKVLGDALTTRCCRTAISSSTRSPPWTARSPRATA